MFRFKRKSIVLFLVLLILTSVTGTVLAGDSVTVNGHTVDFITVEYDTHSANQSSWYYKVTSGSSPALSHITFEIPSCMNLVEAGTWDGIDTSTRNPNGTIIEGGTDPTNGVTGVKFDEGFDDDEMRFYYFTVSGNFEKEDITVGFKGGPTDGTGLITGPNTTCVPTAINLTNFGSTGVGLSMNIILLATLLGVGTFFVMRRRASNL